MAHKLPPSPYRDEPKAVAKKQSTQVTKEPPVPGFSAGTSRPEPPPPPDRRSLVVAGSVATLVVVVAALGYVVASGGGDEAAGPTVTSIVATDSTVPEQPEVGGSGAAAEAVEVVEHGWSVHEDRIGSYGFVIENASDERLRPFIVKVTAYDRDGVVVSGLVDWEHRVGLMRPRERFGVASQLDDVDQADTGISRLEFTVVDDPMAVTQPPDGAIDVSNIVGKDGPYSSTVSYDAASTFPIPLEGDAYVLVRDGAGRIVGGAGSFIDLPPFGQASGDFEFDPASVGGELGGLEVYVVPSTAFREEKSP